MRCQVIDALMTNQGERVFRPRYGCDIQAALFDPTDELVRRDAGAQIKPAWSNWCPAAWCANIKVEIPTTGQRGYVNDHHPLPALVVRHRRLASPCRCRRSSSPGMGQT